MFTVIPSLTKDSPRGLGDLTGWDELCFSVKQDKEVDIDSAAMISVTHTLIGPTTTLNYINGGAPTSGTNAALTIDDEVAGDVTIVIEAVEMASLPLFTEGDYDFQKEDFADGNVFTMASGVAEVVADVTQST